MAAMREKRAYRRGRAWEVIRLHFTSRHAFQEVYRDYEARVKQLVEERGIPREKLELSPGETTRLFDTVRLETLLREQVGPLREASHALFREEDLAELYDSDASKIFHELSILKEEHLSVRDFPRSKGAREFARLFAEVSRYYPQRLRRVRDLFARAAKRLDALLPGMRDDGIVLRSSLLFREELWPEDPRGGLARLLGRMFLDEGGALAGFLAVARSFFRAAFFEQAAECARLGIAEASRDTAGGASRAAQTRDTIREMDKLVSRCDREARALKGDEA
ncbi:MAG: hypothetical protein ACT4PV_04620 [Planctomycetaceae bacterium]